MVRKDDKIHELKLELIHLRCVCGDRRLLSRLIQAWLAVFGDGTLYLVGVGFLMP